VDYVVRGEGERSFSMLIDSLSKGQDTSKIPGISYLKDRELVRNPPPPLLSGEELAELPLPRLDLMPDGYYDLIPVESSRGCYHACIFCSIIYRRNWRGISPEALASRLSRQAHLLSRTRHRSFFIVDDCFTADHERMRRFAEEVSGFQHQFIFEARITDLIAKDMMDVITTLPVRVIETGVECGYDEGLARVGKKLTLAQVAEAAELIEQHDLGDRCRFSFILGLPWETRKEVFKTLEYAFKLTGRLGARLVASWLTLFPGSIIWRKRKEWGIEFSEADYDIDKWWRTKDVFMRSHPGLDPDKDVGKIFTYVQMLMKLFPDIIHDGFFRYIPLD
jgi:anaerobic magnesium-protoporphyrin IX monomethyl ester cyclase